MFHNFAVLIYIFCNEIFDFVCLCNYPTDRCWNGGIDFINNWEFQMGINCIVRLGIARTPN